MVEQQQVSGSGTGEGHTPREDSGAQLAGRVVGWVLGASGIMSGLIGAAASLSSLTVDVALPLASMGALMGVIAYAIGARGIGAVATGLATVALFFAMLISQGEFPGTEPTDHVLPDTEPRSE